MRGKLINERKRQEAEQRQLNHNKLTIEQKIAKIDDKFGKGLGGKKERAKLQKQLEIKK